MHQERYRRGVIRAARVIAVSQATRRDLDGFRAYPDERLSTIYSAPDPAFTDVRDDPAQQRQILDRYSITYPYILYAGTFACTRMSRGWWRRSRCCDINWKITLFIAI